MKKMRIMNMIQTNSLMKTMKKNKTTIAVVVAFLAGVGTVIGIRKYIQKLKRDELLGYIKELDKMKDEKPLFAVEFDEDLDEDFDPDFDEDLD